jgi:hypothetical protein
MFIRGDGTGLGRQGPHRVHRPRSASAGTDPSARPLRAGTFAKPLVARPGRADRARPMRLLAGQEPVELAAAARPYLTHRWLRARTSASHGVPPAAMPWVTHPAAVLIIHAHSDSIGRAAGQAMLPGLDWEAVCATDAPGASDVGRLCRVSHRGHGPGCRAWTGVRGMDRARAWTGGASVDCRRPPRSLISSEEDHQPERAATRSRRGPGS